MVELMKFGLWNRALDANELQNGLCNSPLGAEELIGYWNFNDGSDEVIEDLMGNGNNGTLSNFGIGGWGVDALLNNPLCLGTGECVDSVIVSLPFFHSSTLDQSMEMIGPSKIIRMEQICLRNYTVNSKNLYVDTGDPLTDFDTILSIKDECGNEVSITEFDDGTEDFCPEASVDPPYFASIIDSITLAAGTYYIVVDGWEGATGNYKIAIGTLPEIIGSDIAPDDSYLDIYFSEGMIQRQRQVSSCLL